jgi:hypothetical protein
VADIATVLRITNILSLGDPHSGLDFSPARTMKGKKNHENCSRRVNVLTKNTGFESAQIPNGTVQLQVQGVRPGYGHNNFETAAASTRDARAL